jgi:hypothetical protein
MRKIWLLSALAAGLLSVAPQAAFAQDLDERCSAIIDALCRDQTVSQCFSAKRIWDYVPAKCEAGAQAMAEMDREARQEQREQQQPRSANRAGPSFSCGGVLRAQPRMNAAKVASVAEGQEFDSVEDTGIWTDEYKWFRVRYAGLEGYQWGGIFWTQGGREGTIPSCHG